MGDEAVAGNSLARRTVAAAARRRLVAHLAAGGSTDMAQACMTQPASAYTDPALFAREKTEIFGSWPLVAGLSGDLARIGDVLLFEELDHSILLIRGKDGVARGFLNMCAHRGARLVDTTQHGVRLHRSVLSCPFHGWCYSPEGHLIATPGGEGFSSDALVGRGLIPVPVAEWNGLLLVNLCSGDPALAVDDRLGAFAEPLAQLDLDGLRHIQTSTIAAKCNWKLAIDTYAENYHFGVLHGDSVGDTYVSNITAFDAFGPHWRAHFPERHLSELVGRPESDWPEPVFKAVLFLFPNTVLVVGVAGTDRMMLRTYRIFPGASHDTTVCRMSVYSDADPADLPAGVFADESKSKVTIEDYSIAEGEQANLETAPKGFSLIFGRNEIGVQAFHAAVADALGDADAPR